MQDHQQNIPGQIEPREDTAVSQAGARRTAARTTPICDLERPLVFMLFLGNEFLAQSKTDQTRDIKDIEPFHELGAVILHGFRTDFEDEGDRLGGLTFGD